MLIYRGLPPAMQLQLVAPGLGVVDAHALHRCSPGAVVVPKKSCSAFATCIQASMVQCIHQACGCKAGASGPSVTQLQDAHTAEVRRMARGIAGWNCLTVMNSQWSHWHLAADHAGPTCQKLALL